MDTTDQKDYYRTLGLDKSASQDDVRAAYRRLAFQYHPDRNKDDPAANQKMKEINEAYAVLSDPAKRREYDSLTEMYGAGGYQHYRQTHSEGDIYRGSDIDEIFEEFARQFGFRSSGEVFRQAYGQNYQTFEFRSGPGRGYIIYRTSGAGGQPAPNGEAQQTPSSGMFEKVLRFVVKQATGVELPQRGKDWNDTITITAEAARRGTSVKYLYTKWGKPKNLEVTVPAGITEGQRIRLKAMGAPGKGGGEPGDLYLHVRIKKPLGQRIRSFIKGS